METIVAAFMLIVGACVGSFLNVLVLRLEKGESPTGRSHCPSCGHTLSAHDLVPILSYVFLAGKCRYCRAPISLQYPLVEGVTAFIFLKIFLVQGIPSTFLEAAILLALLLFASLLIAIVVFDLRTKIVPDVFVYPLALCAILILFLNSFPHMPDPYHLIAGPLLFLPFYALWKFSEGRWIGLGDGKLALAMGWLLGIAGGFSAVIIAFWIGAAVGIVLLTLPFVTRTTRLSERGEGFTMKSEVPFAPFLALGLAIVFFFQVNLFALPAFALFL